MSLKEWMSKKWDDFKKSKFYANLKEKTKKLAIKLVIIIAILVLVYLLFLWLKPHFLSFLQRHPTLNMIYVHIYTQISEKTLLGLFYATLFGSLFFITLPMELIILYYMSLEHNIFIIGAIAVAGSTIGLFFDYLIGFLLGKRAVQFLLKSNYSKLKDWVDKYGGFLVFAGSLLPSPIEFAAVIFGTARYSLKKFFLYSVIGRTLKIIALYFLAGFLLTKAMPYISHFF